MTKIPTKENPIPYKFPFRVGRKKSIAILDADSCEIVIFPRGSEEIARITCMLWNNWHKELIEACSFSEQHTYQKGSYIKEKK